MPILHSRKSPRAKRHDYASSRMYFVTICCKKFKKYFGKIQDGKVILSPLGKICNFQIKQLNNRQTVDLHEWIVMPDHVHILLFLNQWNQGNQGLSNYTDYRGPTLGSIIKLFKGHITKYAQENNIPFERQSRFHDRIIPSKPAYERTKKYIQNNPIN